MKDDGWIFSFKLCYNVFCNFPLLDFKLCSIFYFRSWCTAERQEQQETFDFIDSKLEEVTGQIKSKIQSIAEEVEMQVQTSQSKDFSC